MFLVLRTQLEASWATLRNKSRLIRNPRQVEVFITPGPPCRRVIASLNLGDLVEYRGLGATVTEFRRGRARM